MSKNRPTFKAGDLRYTFDEGILTARNIKTNEVARARMSVLRRQYYESGRLPEPFTTKTAQQLIGVYDGDRDRHEMALNGSKRHAPARPQRPES